MGETENKIVPFGSKPSRGQIETHPAAESLRLMNADEMRELVAQITANGLRDPITIGVVDGKRWIADGRNRIKACEIAGVEPRYVEIKFDTEEALIAFIDDRATHRRVNKSQQAIGYALRHPEAPSAKERALKGGRGKTSLESLVTKEVSKAFSDSLLSQARAVLAYSPELALMVRDGRKTLQEPADEVRFAKARANDAEAALAQLELEAPDLAVLVREERMKLSEASAAWAEPVRREEDTKKVATANLSRIVNSLHPRGAAPDIAAEMMFGQVDVRFWPPDLPPLNGQTIEECADVLLSLVKRWPNQGEIK